MKPTRWDWWQVPFEVIKALGPVPGIRVNSNGTFEIHRTHLPLLRQRQLIDDIQLVHALDGGVRPVVTSTVMASGRPISLRPWQGRFLAWAQNRRGVLVAALPRMGKTLAASLLHDPKGQVIILGPLDVRQVWTDTIKQVFDAELTYFEGRTVDVDKLRARFIFSHYDIASEQRRVSVQPTTLIVDEAHLLSNPKSKRSTAVRFFASSAQRVIGLTGTPLWNNVRGLWPVMAVVNPGAWGQSFDFAQRYASPEITEYGWRYGSISNAEEWNARIAEAVFRVDWKTERPDLPPCGRQFVDVPLDANAAAALDDVAAALHHTSKTDDTASAASIGAIARYRQATGKLKIQAAVDQALALSTPVVVWTWHKNLLRDIARAIDKTDRASYIISGDETAAGRLSAIVAWKQDPTGVLLATMSVGQVGIDLSHADRAIFVELDWTPAVLYQAEMRTFTPDRPMTITYIGVDHPVEKMLMETIMEKLNRASSASMPAAGSDFALGDSGGPVDESNLDSLLAQLNATLASK